MDFTSGNHLLIHLSAGNVTMYMAALPPFM